jgi:hypothetical protein
MKKAIIEQVKQIVGEGFLYFDDAIAVKKTPHEPSYRIWAVAVKDERISLMDSSEEWHELEETDINHNLIIASLFQRVMLIKNKVA